jgi:hypothetical protein
MWMFLIKGVLLQERSKSSNLNPSDKFIGIATNFIYK